MWRKQGLKRDLFQADVMQIKPVAWNAIWLQQILLFFSTQNRQRHSSAECWHSTAVSKRRVHLRLWRLGWWRALPPVLSHIYISYQTQRKRERNVINILVNAHMGVTDAPLILLSRRLAGQELLELQVELSQTLTYFWGLLTCTCVTDVRLSERRMDAL